MQVANPQQRETLAGWFIVPHSSAHLRRSFFARRQTTCNSLDSSASIASRSIAARQAPQMGLPTETAIVAAFGGKNGGDSAGTRFQRGQASQAPAMPTGRMLALVWRIT